MKSAKPDMAALIGTCPIHKVIVRAIGYGKRPCQEVIAVLKDVIAQRGQPAVDAAARELLDYEQHGTTQYAALKPHLHVHCRMLLGPMPSEWNTWWQNADGTDRKGKPKVWPPTLPGPRPPTPEERELQALPLRRLADRLHAARTRIRTLSPRSKAAKQAEQEVARIEAEYRRRELTIPVLEADVPTVPRKRAGRKSPKTLHAKRR